MPRKSLSLIGAVGLATLLCGPLPASAQTVGNAQSFAIVGGTGVSAGGAPSTITGDVGVDPAAGTAITGFPASATVVPPFSVHGNDSAAIAARGSITSLTTALGSPPAGAPLLLLPELGGTLVGPGVYNFAAVAQITAGVLTLTTPGLYIFQVPTALNTAVGTGVALGAGVDPCNVFWRVGSLATLNGNFVGNVVAGTGVHFGTGVTLAGRALAQIGGDVTLAGGDVIGGCSTPAAVTPSPTPRPNVCATTAPDLFLVKTHVNPFVTGGNATYSIAMGNNGTTPSGLITVTDTLPAPVAFVSASGVGWRCAASGQIVTCTSTASLPGSITLLVRPGADAVPSVTNNAAVSGGGDCDITNNTASDVATVTAATPVPTLSEWAFIMLALLLTAAGIVALSRRREA